MTPSAFSHKRPILATRFTQSLACFAFLSGAALALAQGAGTNPVVDGFIRPNANLHAENIPPIPASLVQALRPYNDFRPVAFVAWHPSRKEMLVRQRVQGASTVQLHWLKSPGAALKPATQHPDPIGPATLSRDGKFIVYAASKGGSEQFQLFRQDLDADSGAPTGQAVQLTNERERHIRLGWYRKNGRSTGEMLVLSLPLDRFLPEAERENVGSTLRLIDPFKPESAREVAKLPQTGWAGSSLSRDGSTLYMTKRMSANHSEIWAVDLTGKPPVRLIPAADDDKTQAVHGSSRLTADGKALLLITDRFGEFLGVARYELANQSLRSLTGDLPHDVMAFSTGVAVDAAGGFAGESGSAIDDEADDETETSGRPLLFQVNVHGQTELRALDAKTYAPISLPRLPAGAVSTAVVRRGGTEMALSVYGAQTPGDLWVVDIKAAGAANPGEAPATLWAKAGKSLDTSGFRAQEVIRWKSFDGLEISGLITRAAPKFTGKRPVFIDIHGGPESQARVGFAGRATFYNNELGITVIRPNVRGSSGFGKTFLTLDNGYKREDSVKDIGALLDWIAQQPDLDASRVLVSGGSYGGYMALAASTHYADRIAGAIDSVGISNFVTFLETTESYRRDLRRMEYGDERDAKMREFLIRISPTTNAHKITKPLFVVQGKNDPRVPVTEAEQIVAKARANGTPVWYLRGENEGHGFARRENAEFLSLSIIAFMQQTVLK